MITGSNSVKTLGDKLSRALVASKVIRYTSFCQASSESVNQTNISFLGQSRHSMSNSQFFFSELRGNALSWSPSPTKPFQQQQQQSSKTKIYLTCDTDSKIYSLHKLKLYQILFVTCLELRYCCNNNFTKSYSVEF